MDECGPVGRTETAQRYSCAGCEENTVRLFAPRCTSALHVLLRIEQDDVEDLLDSLQHCNCSVTGAGMQSKGFMEQMKNERTVNRMALTNTMHHGLLARKRPENALSDFVFFLSP